MAESGLREKINAATERGVVAWDVAMRPREGRKREKKYKRGRWPRAVHCRKHQSTEFWGRSRRSTGLLVCDLRSLKGVGSGSVESPWAERAVDGLFGYVTPP